MTRRACIYCCREFQGSALAAEPVLPTALGGRLALKRATCSECATRVRRLTDDFLASGFAPVAAAMAKRVDRGGPPAATPPASPAGISPDDWQRAHRAAAKILYCYLLLELGQPVLSSPASEVLRRHLSGAEIEHWEPRYEVTQPRYSPSPNWHVLMFDAAPPSHAAVGLFGTIWFRFRLDLEALAPHGRLAAFDATRGARGMAALRHRGAWHYRSAVRWGWKG